MRLTPLAFLREQFTRLPPVSDFAADLSGKTVLVVGANVGLGFEAARHFSRLLGTGDSAGRLILACRSVAKGEAALNAIHNSTTFTGGEVWELDLASFASVRAFADRYEREGRGSLDLLVANAAVNKSRADFTSDGWEETLQTNHLGTALLVLLLLPYLSRARADPPTPRLVIVASFMHYLTAIYPDETAGRSILEKLNDKAHATKSSVMRRRYAVSKLLNVFFTRALAARLDTSSPLVATMTNPGFCRSELTRDFDANFVMHLLIAGINALLARTTEGGGRTIVHAALGPGRGELVQPDASRDPKPRREYHGQFLSSCRVVEPSDFVVSDEGVKVQERLWDETIEVLSKVDGRVTGIVKKYLSGAAEPGATAV